MTTMVTRRHLKMTLHERGPSCYTLSVAAHHHHPSRVRPWENCYSLL